MNMLDLYMEKFDLILGEFSEINYGIESLRTTLENIEEFYSNPYGRFRFTCNGFENLFRLMKNTYEKKLYKVKNPNLPIHFISGRSDDEED